VLHSANGCEELISAEYSLREQWRAGTAVAILTQQFTRVLTCVTAAAREDAVLEAMAHSWCKAIGQAGAQHGGVSLAAHIRHGADAIAAAPFYGSQGAPEPTALQQASFNLQRAGRLAARLDTAEQARDGGAASDALREFVQQGGLQHLRTLQAVQAAVQAQQGALGCGGCCGGLQKVAAAGAASLAPSPAEPPAEPSPPRARAAARWVGGSGLGVNVGLGLGLGLGQGLGLGLGLGPGQQAAAGVAAAAGAGAEALVAESLRRVKRERLDIHEARVRERERAASSRLQLLFRRMQRSTRRRAAAGGKICACARRCLHSGRVRRRRNTRAARARYAAIRVARFVAWRWRLRGWYRNWTAPFEWTGSQGAANGAALYSLRTIQCLFRRGRLAAAAAWRGRFAELRKRRHRRRQWRRCHCARVAAHSFTRQAVLWHSTAQTEQRRAARELAGEQERFAVGWAAYEKKLRRQILQAPLRDDWCAQMDVATGVPYYLNLSSGEERPEHPALPTVDKACKQQRGRARAMLEERLGAIRRYEEAVRAGEEEQRRAFGDQALAARRSALLAGMDRLADTADGRGEGGMPR
jgi:hypothetical protein